jgi:hypothetical protein
MKTLLFFLSIILKLKQGPLREIYFNNSKTNHYLKIYKFLFSVLKIKFSFNSNLKNTIL